MSSLTASETTLMQTDDDLTDAQVEELLARATERLKAGSSAKPSSQSARPTFNFPKLDAGPLTKAYVSNAGGIARSDNARLVDAKERKLAIGIRKVEDPVAEKQLGYEKKKATTGKDWFDMPRTNLTPELKRDLQLLKMRGVLDPHRHYKKDNGKMAAPEYSQVGTVMEGPTEFFSGRIENKKRKRTFVEEVLAGEQETGRFKKKYNELQTKRSSGRKAFLKALKAKRRAGIKKGGTG